MSRKTALATRFVGPVVAAANGISGCAARAFPASSSLAGSTESRLDGADDLGPARGKMDGLVNPPLASTAIGVVPPQKAGMASGVNSTFRQIGIAAGIAALGSIFNSALQHNLITAPAVGSSAPRIVTMVRQGQVGQLLASLPPARRGVVAEAIRSAFAAGLNDLLIVTAALAFTGAVCALLLIRPKDFVRTGRTQPPGASPATAGTSADSTSPARSA